MLISPLRKWFTAMNPKTLTATATSATVGALTAYYLLGAFNVVRYVLTVIGVMLAQAGVNMVSDYYDYGSGADLAYARSGIRHRVLPIIDLGLSSRTMMIGGYSLIGIAALIGLYLGLVVNVYVVAVLIITGAVLGISYSAPPLKLRYRGIGEVFAALALGPLTGLGAFVVQTGYPAIQPFINTLPNACFTMLALLAAGMLHRETDVTVGKRTLAVILGVRGSGWLSILITAVLYASLALSVLLGYLPPLSLVAVVTLPIALYYIRPMMSGVLDNNGYRRLRALWGGTFSVRVLYMVLVIASMVVARLVW
ncbi:prenyltransferase [Vulcanisaeta souniana]|uniref:1,4-dihydroxy-2-naphthoate octaprenyltransferase n=1 Tax=Vulcanisaeta souniana JCM 11219 TaxID=1293586 RepID=A0A830EGE1_9CREN|nr:prenyltransferase [Vulcanisaeta souniana]BDR91042.1 1,4-dihydroxy-2-naphthoate octaprenyltransferase [Vulcanisaeta souniana JCM 11219]GGI80368.1 1,4-dihydroxy-2-naphthoate octaprenyltransferase [Vulcanisaeta souniana JCM 11219]